MITPSYSMTANERVLPRLALDFTTAVLDPRVTVTRTLNTATRVNSSGLIEIVNADLPRFDYTLNTGGECKGLLIEEGRTNNAPYSETFDGFSPWNPTNTTVTSSTQVAPDGVTLAKKLTATAASGNIAFGFLATINVLYTHSVYVMSATGSPVAGTVNSVGSAGQATPFTAQVGVWTRVSNTQSWASTANRFPSISVTNSGDAIYIWGSQFETGAFPTSYIPNLGSGTTTRNADAVSMTGTNFSDWYNASEGSFVTKSLTTNSLTTNVYTVWVDDTTNQNGLGLLHFNTYQLRCLNAGSSTVLLDAGSLTANQYNRLCGTYKLDAFRASINGGAAALDDVSAVPSGMNRCTFGSFGSFGNYLNGHLAQVLYYKNAFDASEVRAFAK